MIECPYNVICCRLESRLVRSLQAHSLRQQASLFIFRWVYFLSKANMKNRIKIRDSMLPWLKRVTKISAHTIKGHTILYDVYYQLANNWRDERFSKWKSLVCDDFSFLLSPVVTCCDFISIHGLIAKMQLLNKLLSFGLKLGILWLKTTETTQLKLEITFLTVKTCCKQWWVNTFINLSYSIALTACFSARMAFDFKS